MQETRKFLEELRQDPNAQEFADVVEHIADAFHQSHKLPTSLEKSNVEQKVNTGTFCIGKAEVDFDKRVILLKGVKKSITPKETLILSKLLDKPGSVVSHTDLKKYTFDDSDISNNSGRLKWYIWTLRYKLGDDEKRIIVTSRGHGYYIDANNVSQKHSE